MAKRKVPGRQIAPILQRSCYKSDTLQRISPSDTGSTFD